MYMQIFNTDILKVMKLNLLKFLIQKFSLMAIFESTAIELEQIKTELIAYRSAVELRLQYNSQVCYLRAHLNDVYDNSLRRIYIENEPAVPFTVVFRRPEELPLMISKRTEANPEMVNRRDIILYNNSFNVFVPTALANSEALIIESVNKYRLATKTFKILYI